MAMKSMIRTAVIAATLFAAAACIYPYQVDLKRGSEWPLVVEGDIHIGSTTTVTLSHVQPFDMEDYVYEPISARGYIEGEDGTRAEGEGGYPYDFLGSGSSSPSTSLTFDTSALPESQKYRLHLETLTPEGNVSNTFESDWLAPCPAPTIDALSYSHHPEYEELWIGLTMHCHGSHYFRWTFSEVWEYHSDINTYLEYKPQTREVGYFDGPSLYYCWNYANSSKINIFSTVNQTEDRFEELAFHTIPLDDKRLQVLYKITVRLEAMSENAYNYWNNIQQNSEGQGSIFSPTPSEMASNVHCISDASVQVMGYINAATPTEAVMYYDNAENQFYKQGKFYERFDQKVAASRQDSLAYWYGHGYLPYQELFEAMSPDPSHYMFAQGICIDCRRQGGTKFKPADWPNDDR